MAGVKGRSGRRGRCTKDVEFIIHDNRKRAVNLINQYLRDDTVPLKDKIPHAMAINLKMMPDRKEIVSLSLGLSDNNASKLIELAQRNIEIREKLAEMQENSQSPKSQTIEIKQVTDN